MKNLTLFSVFITFSLYSQEMTNEKLNSIYETVSDSIQGKNGSWEFYIENVAFLSLTDVNSNRMRIISPIIDSDKLDNSLMRAAMVANFHTALDVKYAVSDGILWSVFIARSSHHMKDRNPLGLGP